MRVTYDWTEADWAEAVRLATEKQRRRGSVPGTVYALVGIPLIGAVMDGVRSVRGTGKLTGAGLAVPLLLVLLAAVLGASFLFARMQRRKRLRMQMPMPAGQWEAVLQEAGWDFHPKAEDSATALPEANSADVLSGSAHSEPVEAKSTGTQPVEMTWVALPDDGEAPTMADAATVPAAAEIPSVTAAAADAPDAAVSGESEASMTPEVVGADAKIAPNAVEHAMATETVSPARAVPSASLTPWNDLTGSRAGDRVIVLLRASGFQAVPIRCMTPEQASHLNRMLIRKLRPSPQAPRSRTAQ